MKILFSPSEGKIIPSDRISQSGDSQVFQIESDAVSLAAKEAVKQYIAFLQSGDESEITTLFGSKKLDLDELALAQNCLSSPRIEAIRLYNGVGYKALDFESLDSQTKSYMRENLYIFSNLFGMVRADTLLPYYNLHQGKGKGAFALKTLYKNLKPSIDEILENDEVLDLRARADTLLPYYNLHQGKGKGAFALKTLYKNLKPSIDEILENDEVLDLRAEAYLKVYQVDKCKHYTQVVFLKNGKRVSHYAKHYRGIYARVVAQKGVDSSRELEHLAFDELSLYDKKAFENATILTYEVIS